jgi:signal transduction histidine kinase
LLRSLSHDLREPIRSIRGRIDDLLGILPKNQIAVRNWLKDIDRQITQFGDELRAFRERTQEVPPTFFMVEQFMRTKLDPRLSDFMLNLSLGGKSHSRTIAASGDGGLRFRELEGTANRLRRRFDAIRDFADAKGGLRLISFSLSKEVGRVALELNKIISATKTDIQLEGNTEVTADQLKMAQLLQNLFQNSIRYARPGVPPCIQVRIVRHKLSKLPRDIVTELGNRYDSNKEYVTISIADNGQGIPMAERNQVFELFRRGSSKPQDGDDATGIGLAIVLAVAHEHNGTVLIRDSKLGGVMFVVAFPDASRSAKNSFRNKPR